METFFMNIDGKLNTIKNQSSSFSGYGCGTRSDGVHHQEVVVWRENHVAQQPPFIIFGLGPGLEGLDDGAQEQR